MLCRLPSEDPIFAVVYDSTSLARKSIRPIHALSAHKLVLREYPNLVKARPHEYYPPGSRDLAQGWG